MAAHGGPARRLFGAEVGVLWMVLASIVGFAGATLLGAARLNAVDDRLHATNAKLELTVAERTAELQQAVARLEDQARFASGMIDSLNASVAERQRAEETLREREASYRLMFEANPHPMFVYDPTDLAILGVNEAAVHRYGWPREEFLSLTLAALHPPVELEAVRAKVGSIGPGYLTGVAWNHRTRSGEPMEVEVSSHGVHFDGRQGRLVLVHEVTERNRIERELRAKNAELERFTYTVSHDLKSPLVTVRTFAGYLQDDIAAGDAAKVAADLGYISHAADKMAHLLDELLELSRLGRTRDLPVLTSFREIAEEALRLTAGAVSRSGAQVELEPGDVPIRGDRTRLIEIWQNLIDNATKFMGLATRPENPARIPGHRRGHRVLRPRQRHGHRPAPLRTRVRPVRQARSRERRYRRGSGPGTAHRGTLRRPDPGRIRRTGAWLLLYLHATRYEETCLMNRPGPAGRETTVLLVEDDPAHAEIVRRNFAALDLNLRLDHVTDGEAALDYLWRKGPYGDDGVAARPGLVLLDLRLPRLSGLEVLESHPGRRGSRTHPRGRAHHLERGGGHRAGLSTGRQQLRRQAAGTLRLRGAARIPGTLLAGMERATPTLMTEAGVPAPSRALDLLLVEDDAAHVEALRRSFAAGGTPVQLRIARSLAEFRRESSDRVPDLVVMDINLPDGRAMDTLVAPVEAAPFPVLIMTSQGNEAIAVEAIRAGAIDFVVKTPETFARMPAHRRARPARMAPAARPRRGPRGPARARHAVPAGDGAQRRSHPAHGPRRTDPLGQSRGVPDVRLLRGGTGRRSAAPAWSTSTIQDWPRAWNSAARPADSVANSPCVAATAPPSRPRCPRWCSATARAKNAPA